MYLCAILHRRDLGSIRDLNASHIPLLKGIRSKIIESIISKWPEVKPGQLRFFFHCNTLQSPANIDHPSYYHLHLHITHTDLQGNDGTAIGKAWLLEDILEQLSFYGSEGLKRKTFTIIIGEATDLWKQVYSKLEV